jgi:integrase
MVEDSKTGTVRKNSKPQKPHPDFPLFPHSTGRWAKKVHGKTHYFGAWSDPDAALELWLAQKDDLLARRRPRQKRGGVSVADACNAFLASKKLLVDCGELSQRTWADYLGTSQRLTANMGRDRPIDDLRGDDFVELRAKLAKRLGRVSLGNEIQRVRTIFKYAYDSELVPSPVRFGPDFKRPSAKSIRLERAEAGERMLDAATICKLIDAANVQYKAMLYLGVNCGFGPEDVARLPLSSLDLDGGWVNFARRKTGVPRRCPLWPETVLAIRAWLAKRPTPNHEARGYVFITKRRNPWFSGKYVTPVASQFRKVANKVGGVRSGIGFYALRHTLATIGSETKDQVAVNGLMGHIARDDLIPSVYRERISDERLVAVTDCVREWLLAGRAKKAEETQQEASSG